MNRILHTYIGFSVGIVFIIVAHLASANKWFALDVNSLVIYALVILVYCLLADVDHRGSTISFLFIGMSIIGLVAGYIYNQNIVLYSSFGLLIATFFAWNLGHRGFVHSIVFGLLVSLPLLFLFSYQIALLGFAAFYSHLLADGIGFKLV